MSRIPFPRATRILVPIAAAALAGATAPVSVGVLAPSPAAAAGKGFGGYSSTVTATPVRLEFYEPTIPIPADPQLELDLAYTTVEADSGSSLGRASWLWPGDPIGEGAKTFGEQLGLPPQVFAKGYPVQVNSGQPSGKRQQSDEPFPGMVMQTSSSDGTTVAQAGFSPDGKVQDGKDGGGGEGGGEGTPGVPALPGAPGSGVGSSVQQLAHALAAGQAAAADAAPTAPGLPPQVAALIDVEGYTSSSQNDFRAGHVTTVARSALGDVSLLGGLITLDGVVSTSTSGSNGQRNTATGHSVIGGMTVAGQQFSFGPSGVDAAGRHDDVPEVPAQAAAALHKLGVKLVLPRPALHQKGQRASSALAGVRIEIDTSKVRRKLDVLPIDQVVNAVPVAQLKSALQTIAGLSPRVVITLGSVSTGVETVQGIDIPTDVPGNTAPEATGGGPTGGAAPGPSAAGGAPPASGPASAAPPGKAPSADGNLPPSKLTGAGLPPLYSIPGALLVGGIALAAAGGAWLRRIGVIALGGAGSCSHGLDSGVPDLRKA